MPFLCVYFKDLFSCKAVSGALLITYREREREEGERERESERERERERERESTSSSDKGMQRASGVS